MKFRSQPTIQKDTHQASQPWESATTQKMSFPTLGDLEKDKNNDSQHWEYSKIKQTDIPNLGKARKGEKTSFPTLGNRKMKFKRNKKR